MSANLLFFRMHRILDIFFVGGFGTVQWVDPAEYSAIKPDNIVMTAPVKTLQACPAATPLQLSSDRQVPVGHAALAANTTMWRSAIALSDSAQQPVAHG